MILWSLELVIFCNNNILLRLPVQVVNVYG